MAGRHDNEGREGNGYEDMAAMYQEQRRRARDRDAAASAFNTWENEVRKDH